MYTVWYIEEWIYTKLCLFSDNNRKIAHFDPLRFLKSVISLSLSIVPWDARKAVR